MLRFRQIYVRKGTEWDIGEKKGCRALGRLRENRRWMPGSLCEGEMGMGGDAIRRFCGMRPVVTMVGGGLTAARRHRSYRCRWGAGWRRPDQPDGLLPNARDKAPARERVDGKYVKGRLGLCCGLPGSGGAI